jgi:pyruvate kinase
LNLPEAKMFVDPITEQDLKYLDFGLKEGVNLFGVSFVETADDILKLKAYARAQGVSPLTRWPKLNDKRPLRILRPFFR